MIGVLTHVSQKMPVRKNPWPLSLTAAALLTSVGLCGDAPERSAPPADDAWLQQAKSHVLTPSSDSVAPVAIVRTEGRVDAAGALLCEDHKSCRLTFEKGGAKPVVVLDFGKQSVGGYAIFTVTATSGQPVVRLAYANHPDGLSETGDFTRETSARYLGPAVDLPVLPGNVNRHETYTIPRTGRFIAPLLQGQARYLRLQLDQPETAVEIDSVAMVNCGVYDRSAHDGYFLCNDERLNRLWYLSTWTLQIASFPNHDAWKTVDGWLLPRKLEQADDVGLSVAGADWGDVSIDTTFELRANPHHVSAAGVAFRAKDVGNCYLAEIALDGTFRLMRRQHGKDAIIRERRLAAPLTDGTRYHLKIEARGPILTTHLDGVAIDESRDEAFATGRMGFYTPKEKWPLFDRIRVTDGNGQTLLADDFSGDLSRWQFARTRSFVADGAKRDRLIWSGDLYFAQRNAYYAFAHPTYLRDSLKMLAFNQTPEGYVHAAPYPERSVPPASGDYGPFPSDEFAAWLVPVAWEHLLHTDDTATLREIHPALKSLLAYLSAHLGANGLFVQRRETSKHAGNLELGDVRTRSYMNILLWGVYTDAALIADRLGLADDGNDARNWATAIKQALDANLWDETNGYFKEAVETPGFGPEANALALSMGLVTPVQALRITPHFSKIAHGKFQSLASRGQFEYGFAQTGLQTIVDHNWLKLLDNSWMGASTTTECMNLLTSGWGDDSHPDSAIADHFSAYLLGVRPATPGYRTFIVKPQPTREVRWTKGVVPTPHGPITASWALTGDTMKLSLTVPPGTAADVVLPAGESVTVNGRQATLAALKPGTYQIELRGLPAGVWADPTDRQAAAERELKPVATASSSHEEGGWGLANLFAPSGDVDKKGYSSGPSTGETVGAVRIATVGGSGILPESSGASKLPKLTGSGDTAVEWLEFDLGAETTLAKIVLLPRDGTPTAGFPRDFKVQFAKQPGAFTTLASYTDCPAPGPGGLSVNLYLVIGFPAARYVRIAATRLGDAAIDEPNVHRLQFSRIRLLRP